jgi:hypothetical protein
LEAEVPAANNGRPHKSVVTASRIWIMVVGILKQQDLT